MQPVQSRQHDWIEEAQQALDDNAGDTENDNKDEAARAQYPLSNDQLRALVDPKNAYVLYQIGGLPELANKLHSNLDHGLSVDQSQDISNPRVARYGRNVLPEKKAKSLLKLMWIAFQDKVLIILTVAAIVSFALGMYQTFGQPPEYDDEGNEIPKVEWVEGVAIIVAVLIVVVVGAVNDWQKEKQFVKLNKKKEDRKIKVMRGSKPEQISVHDLLVGDLLLLEPGDMLPGDGVLVKGFDVKCDESAASGESATLTKHEADKVTKLIEETGNELDPTSKKLDAFLLSGGKVVGGTGVCLVTAVGTHSYHGRTLMSLQDEDEATPLQEKLNNMAEAIAKFGVGAAVLLFIVLFIRFLVEITHGDKDLTSAQKGNEFMKLFITAITIIVVAVPEGLPLAVTLALAFATTRMVKDNNLVRVLKACETMGGATTVCSDKTGTLTQNRMTVVAATLGSNIDEPISISEDGDNAHESLQALPEDTRKLLLDSIAINSSAFENQNSEEADGPFVGSKTETALLEFGRKYMDLGDLETYRAETATEQVYPFDSAKKFMATVIDRKDGKHTVLLKGASEVVLRRCGYVWDASTNGPREMTDDDVKRFKSQIYNYASRSLRTLGLVYKTIPNGSLPDDPDQAKREEELFGTHHHPDYVFLCLVGIQDPLRPGVRKAVEDCQRAGVVVRMVTGDNLQTAKAIAKDCGIIKDGDVESGEAIVMEGPKFRSLDHFEMYQIVPKLRVLARSSPQDKRKLVKILKSQKEVVAVTGDGTNDAPALKLADVGFSMGIAGTEVAKEASEIVLMDDNFGSIVKGIMWGRTVNDAVKKFLQFQLTVNVTAVLLTFVSAVASSENASVLTAVQLLWVNLIMDTFAALALATDPPSPSVLDREPDGRTKGLITVQMWKMIMGQAVFQLAVTFVLHFAGDSLFNVDDASAAEKERMDAMVFNTFVWMQFFNIFCNRRLDNKFNILEGILRNWYFIVIVALIGGIQVMIMFVGGAAFSVKRQTGGQWATALICGVCSIPMAMLIRSVPDWIVIKLFPTRVFQFIMRNFLRIGRKKDNDDDMVPPRADEENSVGVSYRWHPAIEQVREQLVFIKKLRGGRMSNLQFKPKQMYDSWKDSRSPSPSPGGASSPYLYSPTLGGSSASTHSRQQPSNTSIADNNGLLSVPDQRSRRHSSSSSTIGAMAMVPTIVGGAVAGWSPSEEQAPALRRGSD